MAKISPLAVLPPVVFAALAGLFFSGMFRDDPNALPSTIEGNPAPAVALTQLGDRPAFTNEVFAAEGVKLVNYWASWCAPCRAEHPMLMELADEGFPIYGINYKDPGDNAVDFLAELGNPYVATAADRQGRTALDWGVYGVPEKFVIDGDGNVVLRFAGPVTAHILEKRIRPAIEAAQK